MCTMYGSPLKLPKNSKSISSWFGPSEDSCNQNYTLQGCKKLHGSCVLNMFKYRLELICNV